MKKLALATALGATYLALAACGERAADNTAAENNVTAVDDGAAAGTADTNGAAAGTAGAGTWAKGARIVEENGVTWRIDADGTRVRLGEGDSRIVVENGVRYRVDASGTRVRISDDGIDLTPDIDLPDVDVGINKKGNPDIDVKDKDDGTKGPD